MSLPRPPLRPLVWRANAASNAPISRVVIGNLDNHEDLHIAAVVGTSDQVPDTSSVSTTQVGYRALLPGRAPPATSVGSVSRALGPTT
ncbi:hypothetical protein J4573_02230 [Actinomadura barringtoniae]|uniref:Uncharacterized protein n=1 Tax=Actinomadura barringtoniae TaxID=1427535 RepID=A0A939T0P8_9ACTN|nr:hypothetical protein [Actinomadura barringtoniae]MBO2445896.1 hypothetical protein [Actinomadura barringtoniae]